MPIEAEYLESSSRPAEEPIDESLIMERMSFRASIGQRERRIAQLESELTTLRTALKRERQRREDAEEELAARDAEIEDAREQHDEDTENSRRNREYIAKLRAQVKQGIGS